MAIIIDVYQATTQMTDESGQTYPYTIDTLLDKAIGPEGYYGVFTANMHTDTVESSGSDAIVSSALARGIPVVSARQMLDLAGRPQCLDIQFAELERQHPQFLDQRRPGSEWADGHGPGAG